MRIERDSMGEMQVPDDALYGAKRQGRNCVMATPASDAQVTEE